MIIHLIEYKAKSFKALRRYSTLEWAHFNLRQIADFRRWLSQPLRLSRLLQEAPSWRKLEMVDQLNQSVKLLALAGLRQNYPHENEDQIRRRLAELLLGEELACKVYGAIA